jgi:hypothetical protein
MYRQNDYHVPTLLVRGILNSSFKYPVSSTGSPGYVFTCFPSACVIYQHVATGTYHYQHVFSALCLPLHPTILLTSGFWPRVRARALRAPIFLSS